MNMKVLYGYSIVFDYKYLGIKGDPASWDQDAVLIIYLFPLFVIAILIVWLHLKQKKNTQIPGFKPIFIYWLILFFSYRVVGMLPAHLYSFTGIHHAFDWLYFGMIVKVLMGLSAVVIFFIASVWLYGQIYYVFGTINNNFRLLGLRYLLLATILIPIVICCAVSALFFCPGLPKEEILGLIFLVLPVIYTAISLIYKHNLIASSKQYVEEVFYQWQIFVAILVLIVVLRILLGIGISIN
ncbi:MAG: hypothetical protein HGA23_02660 [Bacteroidales bacterium]|nr:hypothetical protein [Bacteroidales bacterium]